MTNKRWIFSYLLMFACLTSPVTAALPSINEEPFQGYFIAIEHREFHFGLTRQGDATFDALDRKKKRIRASSPVSVQFHILNDLISGKTVRKKINKRSLNSKDAAQINPMQEVSFGGKVTGDAKFTVRMKAMRDGFILGGNILDLGKLKDEARFVIEMKFTPYEGLSFESEKTRKNFKKMVRRDRFEIITLKGEKIEMDMNEIVDLKAMYPKGVRGLNLKTLRYANARYEIFASKGAAIHFINDDGAKEIYKSLNIEWQVSRAGDPTKETLTFEVN